LRSHDSGRNEELLTPNIHHGDNQETKTQKVLDWEPVLGTPTVSKTMPCSHLLASLALLHFNDSSLHQAVNSTKQNLLSCNSNPSKTFVILQFLQTVCKHLIQQEEIPATPQLPALTSSPISLPQLQVYNPQNELQLKILLKDLMKKERKHVLLFPPPPPPPPNLLPHTDGVC